MLEQQAVQAEKDARQRIQLADERAEWERAKGHNQRLTRQIDSLEGEVDRLTSVLRKYSRRDADAVSYDNDGLLTNEVGTGLELGVGGVININKSEHVNVNRPPPVPDVVSSANAAVDVSAMNLHNNTNLSTTNAINASNVSNIQDESAAAVSELQGQLVWMKAQLNMALDRTAEKRYDQSLHGGTAALSLALGTGATGTGTGGGGGGLDTHTFHSTYTPSTIHTRNTSIRQPRVTFSPEALWASPDPRTVVRSIEARMTETGTARPEKNHQLAAGYGYGTGGGEQKGDISFADQSAIDRSYAHYDTNNTGNAGNTGNSNFTSSSARLDVEETKSALPVSDDIGVGMDRDRDRDSFEGIQDGGYHEGYWKARYSK